MKATKPESVANKKLERHLSPDLRDLKIIRNDIIDKLRSKLTQHMPSKIDKKVI